MVVFDNMIKSPNMTLAAILLAAALKMQGCDSSVPPNNSALSNQAQPVQQHWITINKQIMVAGSIFSYQYAMAANGSHSYITRVDTPYGKKELQIPDEDDLHSLAGITARDRVSILVEPGSVVYFRIPASDMHKPVHVLEEKQIERMIFPR